MFCKLAARSERWPLARPFRIARGVKTAAEVVVVEACADGAAGMGEAVPYARYGESVESVLAQIESVAGALAQGMTRSDLQRALAPGAARNAIDCALWDLEAKLAGSSAAALAGTPAPGPLVTAVTVSLDAPEKMEAAAREVADAPLIKIKVDAADPVNAVLAVRRGAPDARLIVDPNESWSLPLLIALLPEMAKLGVALLEQPISAAHDEALEGLVPVVPLCADEAVHTRADLDRVTRRYQAVNIKLDKTGGLTEALALKRDARERGLKLMVGCMVCTSLAVLPALLLAHDADFVDLDGPWWLAQDRAEALGFRSGLATPPATGWGRSG